MVEESKTDTGKNPPVKTHSKHIVNFERLDLKFRNAGKGLWLITLLPLMLCCCFKYSLTYSHINVTTSYKTLSIISIGQLITALYDALLYFTSEYDRFVFLVPIGYIISSIFVSCTLVLVIEQSILYSLIVAIGTSVAYHHVFKATVRSCPNSFSYGEAVITTQSLILYAASYLSNTFVLLPRQATLCDTKVTYILQSGFCMVLCVIFAGYYYPRHIQNVTTFLLVGSSSFFLFVIFIPYMLFRINSLLWVIKLTCTNIISASLIIYWLAWCAFACSCCYMFIGKQERVSTVTRKYFHFAILFVLLPGIYLRPCLMYLASGVGFAILVMIEVCRLLKIAHISSIFQQCFDTFRDEKDEGGIALTPLYLMIGCVAPIWLYPSYYSNSVPLPVISGILAVAVGDTAASIVGSKFGVTRWSQSSTKTIEGTVGSVLAQLVVYRFLVNFGLVTPVAIQCTEIIIFVIVSVVEALTDQIDNLVLPLVGYILCTLAS